MEEAKKFLFILHTDELRFLAVDDVYTHELRFVVVGIDQEKGYLLFGILKVQCLHFRLEKVYHIFAFKGVYGWASL